MLVVVRFGDVVVEGEESKEEGDVLEMALL